ncbi:hypothetical protein BDN67DRAFT_491852 [Paxillus ammoniavirescens]|nr:hypothetical protein BDN67DRAFT_491852 [Paxillus ammoniavirescens]
MSTEVTFHWLPLDSCCIRSPSLRCPVGVDILEYFPRLRYRPHGAFSHLRSVQWVDYLSPNIEFQGAALRARARPSVILSSQQCVPSPLSVIGKVGTHAMAAAKHVRCLSGLSVPALTLFRPQEAPCSRLGNFVAPPGLVFYPLNTILFSFSKPSDPHGTFNPTFIYSQDRIQCT